VLSLDPHTVDDVLGGIEEIGRRIGADAEAAALVADLRARLEAVRAAVKGRPRPRVLVLEWIDPPFLAGHWVPELVHRAGGQPVAGAAGGRSRSVGWDDVAALPADVGIVAPCGVCLDEAAAQATAVRDRLPAGRVVAIDSASLVVRPGPRLVDGVEAMAWALHPDTVPAPPPGRVAQV
jgi:iron complex transport system substrate-binding protein